MDLSDPRDFYDELGRLQDYPRGPEPVGRGLIAWAHESCPAAPERRDAYLRRLETMQRAGEILPDGTHKPQA